MRRSVGVSKIRSSQRTRERYDRTGNDLAKAKRAHIAESLEEFKIRLSEFAKENASVINEDVKFREKFHAMCALVGVDVLATTKRTTLFGNVFGALNDFYVELGVKILNLSIQTRADNGGLLPFARVLASLPSASADDVRRSVAALSSLGSGLNCMTVDGKDYVSTLDPIKSTDELVVLDKASTETRGRIDAASARRELGEERTRDALAKLMSQSIVWIDSGEEGSEDAYFVQSLFSESSTSSSSR